MGVRYPDRRSRARQIERELAAIPPRIVDSETERVILFGSGARGDLDTRSDLDLLVGRRDPRRPAERADDLYRRARATVAMDLLVFTPEELAAGLETSSFPRRVVREGRIVHERTRS